MTKAQGSGPRAYLAGSVFDGRDFHKGVALVVKEGRVAKLVPAKDLPKGAVTRQLGPGVIAPGFVDLQVNGGGGQMFNDAPGIASLEHIASAHARLGATSILPTLITDTPEKTRQAIDAAVAATRTGLGGIVGLHLEGPHLAAARRGAHDAGLIRPMGDDDLALLLRAARALPVLMVTLAPEAVQPEQIASLSGAGVIVCLGHTDARFDDCERAMRSGARGVTHLFNAMRQSAPREPGVVGAALALGGLSAGMIADGIHVHPANMGAALRAKVGPGGIYLVSDAMACAGSEVTSFQLNGRTITRSGGRLTLEDGTLAGADLTLARAVQVMTEKVGLPLERALAMATSVPAEFAGLGDGRGHLAPGGRADFVHLDDAGALAGVWQGGARL